MNLPTFRKRFPFIYLPLRRGHQPRRRAETLSSTLVGVGVASILFAALATVYLYSARAFAGMGNYVDLDSQTRLALDYMSRDIRQADSLLSYSTNALTFQYGTNQLQYIYNSGARTLTRQLGSANILLLTDCDNVYYSIFQRPTNTYESYATASVTNCKIVQVTLQCSRSLLGRKENDVVQSAKIVIRK